MSVKVNLAISNNKPEKVIRELYKENLHNLMVEAKKQELIVKYENLYPELDENNEVIYYLTYDKVVTVDDLDKGENTKPVFPDYIYKADETGNITNELKDIYKDLPIRPSLNLYIKQNLEVEELTTELNVSEYLDFIKPILKDKIQKLADDKFVDAKKFLAQKMNLTVEQVERYEIKYDVAKDALANKDYTLLEGEASDVGMTGEDYAKLIVKLHDDWTAKLRYYTMMIETYRVRAQRVIDKIQTLEQIDIICELMEKAKHLSPDTKLEDIEKMFEIFNG